MAVAGTWAYALAQFAVLADRPVELLAGAAVAAALLLATLLALRSRALPGAPRSGQLASALRARARGRRVPRQADPDAAGRPRPRAPGPHPSAA